MLIWKKIKLFLVVLGWPIVRLGKTLFKKFRRIPWDRPLVVLGWPIIKSSKKAVEKIKKICWDFLPDIKLNWRWFWLILLATAISGGIMWFYKEVWAPLPNINLIYNPPKLSTVITDRSGNVLYKFYDKEDRSWVSFRDIPHSMVEATVAIEDKDFYKHNGISIKGIVNALWYDVRNGSDNKLRGGSTITQQLIKNVFFNNEQTLPRKLKELILTIEVEKQLSKDEILERYLNQVPFGGETYGVSEAAFRYFGKDIKNLTPAESAMLAGLIAAPSSYSPKNGNLNYALLRQKHVIEEMVTAGFIDQAEASKIMAEKIEIKNEPVTIASPHWVFYVKDYLQQNFGFQNFSTRGLKITTTLDSKVQLMAETITNNEVENSRRLGFSNGAAVVTNPKNGDILAMVGSKDYWAADIDGKYNVTTALRQPGSSIKPINYVLAFMNGKTPETTIEDEPITYNIPGQKPYSPKDYTGKYLGTVTLRTALASSLNIPSVKLLADNGVNNMIDLAQKMGITTWNDRSRYGLSLALGAGEVKMVDMATAYGTFANMGTKVKVNPILKIQNYLGETIYNKEIESENIIPPEYAFLIDDILSDNTARTPIFGPSSKLRIEGKTVAVKTGTTNSLKDNWCIGWTPDVLVATWVGNNDSSPMSWVASGVSGATPIWNRIMTQMTSNMADKNWNVPDKIVKVDACGRSEYMIRGTENNVHCSGTPTPNPDNVAKAN